MKGVYPCWGSTIVCPGVEFLRGEMILANVRQVPFPAWPG